MEHTATYSPEDNKLRLYPAHRLDAEVYARVWAAGFKWAPKQELFVAAMWTPSREDLLLEMCGAVDDEDTSLADRAEAKADRADEAERAHDQVAKILVGRHSEKRARKDAQKIQDGMRKAVSCWKAAEYWKDRAKGAIRHAKYKERPDVRARRIKGIEADIRKATMEKESAALWLRRQIARADRWLEHYENRLAYEKAMLIGEDPFEDMMGQLFI